MKKDYQIALDAEIKKQRFEKFKLGFWISFIPMFLIITLFIYYFNPKEVRLFIGLSSLMAGFMLLITQAKILMEWFK